MGRPSRKVETRGGGLARSHTRPERWQVPFSSAHVCSLLGLMLFRGSCVDDSGLLVHCISGWDRTPLFISLLRLSLWAVSMDGLGHGVRERSEALTEMYPLGVLGQFPKRDLE